MGCGRRIGAWDDKSDLSFGEVGDFPAEGGDELIALGVEVFFVGSHANLGFDAVELAANLYAFGGDATNVVAVAAVGAGEVPLFTPIAEALGGDGGCEAALAGIAGGWFHFFSPLGWLASVVTV